MIIARYDVDDFERYRIWGTAVFFGLIGSLTGVLLAVRLPGSPWAIPFTAIFLAVAAGSAYLFSADYALQVEITETEMRWRHLYGRSSRPLTSVRSATYFVRRGRYRIRWPWIVVKFTDRRSLWIAATQPNTAVFLSKLKTAAPHAAVTSPPR